MVAKKTTRKNVNAFVLPTLMLLTLVLLVLSAAVLNLGTTGLRTTSHDLGSQQALYAAEAGLVRAAEVIVHDGELTGPLEGVLESDESSYRVVGYYNPSSEPMEVISGLYIPPSTVYLHSVGTSSNRVKRSVGALFRTGLGGFQVGALVRNLQTTNAIFDAYDSGRESASYSGEGYDPSAKEHNRGILATNLDSGTVFSLGDTTVEGSIFVGPGGNPNDQVSQTGETVIGNISSLQNPIELEDIEVPDLPPGEGDGEEFEPEDPLITQTFYNLTVSPSAGGSISFGNSCFSMTVQPNGDFVAQETPGSGYAGGNLSVKGNIHDIRAGGSPIVNQGPHRSGGTGFELTVEDGVFHIAGSWHQFSIDSSGQVSADGGPASQVGNGTTGYLATQTYSDAPDWLVYLMTGAGGGVHAENPNELVPGEYDSVTINSGTTRLADKGTYVIDNLTVGEDGELNLPADRGEVNIYVTGTLKVEGENAIANATRKAPNLNIFYLGSEPVQLIGGSKAFFTLMAPEADLNLSGTEEHTTDFFGALVGRSVKVDNARFHYDIATEGIGVGADASTIQLLSKHR